MCDYQKCPYYESKCNIKQSNCLKLQAWQDAQDPNIIKQELIELNIDPNLPKWDKIMAMQASFAKRFVPEEKTISVINHWVNEFLICIEDEFEELIDYINLLNRPAELIDLKGLRKETIDILHFVMESFIAGKMSAAQLKQLYNDKYQCQVNDLFNYAFNQSRLELATIFSNITKPTFNKDILYVDDLAKVWNIDIEQLHNILLTLSLDLLLMNRKIRTCISWKHWKKPNDTIDFDKLYNYYLEMFINFMRLISFIFDNSDEVINAYVIKNIENIRRQKLGY